MRQQLLGGARAVLRRELRELCALEHGAWIQPKLAGLLVEQPAPELDAAHPLLALQHVLDLAART